MTRMRADVQSLVAKSNNPALALNEVRNKHFLAWDDDSGDGYAAAFQFDVPASGDYALFAASSLSVFGRATAGDYELLIGLDAPGAQAERRAGRRAHRRTDSRRLGRLASRRRSFGNPDGVLRPR